eukprot:gene7996-12461_t
MYLPLKEVINVCTHVSTSWNGLIKHEKFWKTLIETQVGYHIKEYEPLESIEETTTVYPWYKMYREILKSSWTWRRAVSIFNTFDEHFRVVLLGDKKVGKSALLLRLVREKFESEQYMVKNISKFEMSSRTTRVIDMKTDTTVKLQFYDTNIEDYDNYIKESNKYLSLAHAVIIVYNITKKQSFFNAIGRWYQLVAKRKGMKEDCEKQRAVTKKDGEKAAKQKMMHHYEINAWTKNELIFNNMIQNIGHTLYNNFIEGKAADTNWTRKLETDKNIQLIQKRCVCVIPQPEYVDPMEHCFENDDPANFKEDEDEIRLQNMMKSKFKEETVDEEEETGETSAHSPLVSFGSKSLMRKNQSVLVNPLRKPSLLSMTGSGNKKRFNPMNTEARELDSEAEEIDLEKEEIEFSLSDDEEYYDMGLDDSTVVLNESIPEIEENDEFLSYWPDTSDQPKKDQSVDSKIEPKKAQEKTAEAPIQPKSTTDVKPKNAKKPVFKGLTPIGKKKDSKKVDFLMFDFTESKATLQNQVLSFAKKLRDDPKLNKLLTPDDRTTLKGLIKETYDWLNKNKEAPKEDVDTKCQELEEKVNIFLTTLADK